MAINNGAETTRPNSAIVTLMTRLQTTFIFDHERFCPVEIEGLAVILTCGVFNSNDRFQCGHYPVYVAFTQRWMQRQRQLSRAERFRVREGNAGESLAII